MSDGYKPILWNKFKKQYDIILWVTILLYLALFIGFSVNQYPTQNINTTLIRAFGTLAILLLHVILAIGPLSRLSNTYLPLLYNRRHLGVSMFCIALVHSILCIIQFHSNGNINPLLSLFTSNLHYNSLLYFPFETLGFVALIILALMAFTSHDFWLHFLSPKFWKTMHMLVYIAYALIILHVALGIIQFETSPLLVLLLFAGSGIIAILHLLAAVKENKTDGKKEKVPGAEWVYVCDINDIEESRAKMVVVNNERVAVFKYDTKLSAVHNVCKHQMGPLGEGKVVDGCITCPWHGYQYRPEDGCAPHPFTEKIATYQLKLIEHKVYVNTAPLPEGTFIAPVNIPTAIKNYHRSLFFIGWAENNRKLFSITRIFAFSGVIVIILMSLALSSSQQKISGFKIDYESVQQIEGWVTKKPVASLKIIEGKDAYGNPIFKTILLLDAFKFGADTLVSKILKGDSIRYVKLKGYLNSNIIDCGQAGSDCATVCTQCITGTTNHPVMDIENGVYSFENASEPVKPSVVILNSGRKKLIGEIIDPKCYFGAMNPGYGKPHLSCAARCISGGIMPVLKYMENNTEKYAVLTGSHGEAINDAILNFIGAPVEVEGNFSSIDNWDFLQIDPAQDLHLIQK